MDKRGTQKSRCEGYTVLSYTGARRNAPLINMNGKTVHEWSIHGQPVKMLPGGSLIGYQRNRMGNNPLRADPPPSPEEPLRRQGGWQDAIEFVQVDWNGREEWCFSSWDDDQTGVMMSRQHHDFQREGNPVGYYAPGQDFIPQGKTLILAHKNKMVPEISYKELEDDVIYEVDWDSNLTGYEWHTADHFNEYGFDRSARADIYKGASYNEDRGHSDWLHINSISLIGKNHWYDETGNERFHPENIIISSRHANFIAIFSRATGNILWRVGPDFSEGTPEHGLGQFMGQHHAHMIPTGLPGEGNILVFDNGGSAGYGGPNGYPRFTRGYSRVIEFNPITLEKLWEYGAESGEQHFFSQGICSAQRLPNGNTMIADGRNGRIFEVTPDKEKVWEYIARPSDGGEATVYRAYRVPPEWVPGNPSGYTEWATLYR